MDAQRVNKAHPLIREATVPARPVLHFDVQIVEALWKETANNGNVAGVEITVIFVDGYSSCENIKYTKQDKIWLMSKRMKFIPNHAAKKYPSGVHVNMGLLGFVYAAAEVSYGFTG